MLSQETVDLSYISNKNTYKILRFNGPLLLICIHRHKCSSTRSCLGPLDPIITQIHFTCQGLPHTKRGAGWFVLCFPIDPTYFGNRHFRHFFKKPGIRGTSCTVLLRGRMRHHHYTNIWIEIASF